MADSAAGKDWRKDWDALGKQYWEAWTEGARAATKGDPRMLHEGFEQWSRLFAPKADNQSDVVERMASADSGVETSPAASATSIPSPLSWACQTLAFSSLR